MPSTQVKLIENVFTPAQKQAPYFREAGSGTAVVCIHSSASSSGQWRALMERLADRFRVIAVDLYGSGKTAAWPEDQPMQLDDELALLSSVFRAAGDRFHLVGHSFGGAVAMKAALADRDRLLSLVLYEPVLFSVLIADAPESAAACGDHLFDLTVSVFGAMFAPKPFEVAKEMVRVTKPGGHIVMGNWIPNDSTFVSQLLKISSAFTPPPPEGFVSPMTWGVDTHVAQRFAEAGVRQEKISTVKDTFHFKSLDQTPAQFIDLFRRFYGPTMNAFDAAEKNGKAEELHSQLLELAEAQNQSKNGGTFIPATFLRVTVSV